ncbi:MAG: hypothetical protein KF816_08060 [Melioribacteraceae bacterium]|nr:hypothetical protein [Melioribacteraceae bacterium]
MTNSIWKSIILNSLMLLLSFHFCVTASIIVSDYEISNEQSTNTVITSATLSDVINVRDNNQSKGERELQVKRGDLFILIGHIIAARISYFIILRKQSLITSITPAYLLSSDLKSPPFNS